MISRLDRILSTKTLSVGLLRYSPLVDFAGESGIRSAYGVFVKLLSDAMRELGVTLSFQPVRFDQLGILFEALGADCMIPVFPTKRRQELGDVIARTHEIGLGAIARVEHAGISSIEEVFSKGLRVVVAAGEVGDEYLHEHLSDFTRWRPRITHLEAENLDSMIVLVREQIADIAIVDSLTCHRSIRRVDPKERTFFHLFREKPLEKYPTGILTPKNDVRLQNWLELAVGRQFYEKAFLDFEALELRDLRAVVQRREDWLPKESIP